MNQIKLSIIIAIYNSHEAVRRQVLWFTSMDLPDDIEIIFVDDGSNPPLGPYNLKNLRIIQTNDKRPWTQGLARNRGIKEARGEYLLLTDIDHILSKEAIMDSHRFTGDRLIFPRYIGVLLEDGSFTQDPLTLGGYGLDKSRLKTSRGLYASYHGNTFCIKKSTIVELGGYSEKHCTYLHHAGPRRGEDSVFNSAWNHWARSKGIVCDVGSKIYIFPIGRYNINGDLNPQGLFHNLSQAQEVQPMKG